MAFDGGSADSLKPGTALFQGQFLIERFLNSGGFGITYLARDSLDRMVVLKECYPSTMCCRSREIVRARSRVHQREFDAVVRLFGQEARRLAKLDHPNIVRVHQVFEDNGTAYMAMDFIEGRDLLDVVEQEPERLSPESLQALTLQVLDAISHVHNQGMLHRDISPDNILLDPRGRPVLIDFGAARDTARRASRVLSALHVVKDGYSPQEFYLTGTDQTPASDLYSLAATLHHLITGAAPPFSHDRLAALAGQQPDPYRPLEGRVPGFSSEFLQAIDQTLAVFAPDRLQSAEAWTALIAPESGVVVPATAPRIRPVTSAANATAAVAPPVQPPRASGAAPITTDLGRLVAETNAAVIAAREQAVLDTKAQEEAAARERAEAEEARARALAAARAEAEAEAREATIRAEAAARQAEIQARLSAIPPQHSQSQSDAAANVPTTRPHNATASPVPKPVEPERKPTLFHRLIRRPFRRPEVEPGDIGDHIR